jgi:hypothetical protein
MFFWISYLTWIFSQIGDDLPVGAGVNPIKFQVNRSNFSLSRKWSKFRKMTIFAIKVV